MNVLEGGCCHHRHPTRCASSRLLRLHAPTRNIGLFGCTVESLRPTRLGPLEGYETCTCSNGFVCSDDQSGGSDLHMGAAAARCASRRPRLAPRPEAERRVDDPPAPDRIEPPFGFMPVTRGRVPRGLTAFTKVNLRHTTPSHTYNKNGQAAHSGVSVQRQHAMHAHTLK